MFNHIIMSMGKRKTQTISFDVLMQESQKSWTEAEWELYEAVSADFQKEVHDRKELGATLNAARKELALTQPQLALKADIQQAEISRIERGVGNPTATTLFRLTHALGLKMTFLPADKAESARQ